MRKTVRFVKGDREGGYEQHPVVTGSSAHINRPYVSERQICHQHILRPHIQDIPRLRGKLVRRLRVTRDEQHSPSSIHQTHSSNPLPATLLYGAVRPPNFAYAVAELLPQYRGLSGPSRAINSSDANGKIVCAVLSWRVIS